MSNGSWLLVTVVFVRLTVTSRRSPHGVKTVVVRPGRDSAPDIFQTLNRTKKMRSDGVIALRTHSLDVAL